MIEINEVLYRWLQGMSIKGIVKSLGISRNTVRRIILQAQQAGMTRNSNIDEIEASTALSKTRYYGKKHQGVAQEYIARHHEQIAFWRQIPYMTVKQMVRLFHEQGKPVSETSLHRYIHKHFANLPQSTVHLETVPGQQAQVDFCYAGLMVDPVSQKQRKSYAFVMLLAHSRHRFVRFVFKQDTTTWVDCHIRAFHFFGGVPETVMLDNLKAGVLKADVYDPTMNRSYGECERHYGFVCDPNKIRMAQHKGKVERGMPVIRQQLLAGRQFKDIEEANAYALQWCRHGIGQQRTRSTGQTPWSLFEAQEKASLKPLPATDYACALWQELKVHRDHHLVLEGSYYSVPTAYIGRKVWVRASTRMVDIYVDHHKIKSHVRAQSRGQWVTDQHDYPEGKNVYLQQDQEHCLKQGERIGPFTLQLLKHAFKGPTRIGQRKAQAILRLSRVYGESRLELACQRSLSFDNYTYRSIKKILAHNLDRQELSSVQPPYLGQHTSYVRPACEFIALQGGVQ